MSADTVPNQNQETDWFASVTHQPIQALQAVDVNQTLQKVATQQETTPGVQINNNSTVAIPLVKTKTVAIRREYIFVNL